MVTMTAAEVALFGEMPLKVEFFTDRQVIKLMRHCFSTSISEEFEINLGVLLAGNFP